MNIVAGEYKLLGLSKLNIILGKNGCGKSSLLRDVEGALLTQPDIFGALKYITPERGGTLVYEAGIEQQLNSDVNSLPNTRRVNQSNQFRQQTIAQYRTLETTVLRALESSLEAGKSDHPPFFNNILSKINSLLDNIKIQRDPQQGPIFKIVSKSDEKPVDATSISSGESELISLAIESLAFAEKVVSEKRNILFLDEPDVHLHPDLQTRLTKFLIDLVDEYDFEVIIATHSTALLGELSEHSHSAVALMKPGQRELSFESVDEQYRQILPVFGAHPLSNIFNSSPILLLEGEDDVRIWQQVVRSSEGAFKLYPVQCETINKMNEYEKRVVKIIESVYDKPVAFSLRDKDDDDESIDDIPPLIRMRLSCRAAENLLLSDDVLSSAGIDWDEFKKRAEKWMSDNPKHAKFEAFNKFKDGSYDRKQADLKELRVLIVGAIMASDKPWEVLVGQAIAKQKKISTPTVNSLQDYLGAKVVASLIPA